MAQETRKKKIHYHSAILGGYGNTGMELNDKSKGVPVGTLIYFGLQKGISKAKGG